MSTKKLVCIVATALCLSVLACAQEAPKKEIKNVPIRATSPASGVEMYGTYCAVCHGMDGKGQGPAAEALKVPPSDLTTLAKRNGGKFPDAKVSSAIRGEQDVTAHGTRDMPMWGGLFRSMSGGHQSEVQMRVRNLSEYIKTLQKD
jgi:mono/diheme cytochrome c family protein